jgi:hypothetical protein
VSRLSWDWDGYTGYGPDVRGPELWRWIWKFFPGTFVMVVFGLVVVALAVLVLATFA